MGTVIDEKEFRRAQRKARRREVFGRKTEELSNWIRDHEDILKIAVPVGTGAVAVVTKGVRAAAQHRRLKKTQDLKELYCYDRSLGHYWKLRRELTNEEWVAIDRRKKNGERLADILNELKVLK